MAKDNIDDTKTVSTGKKNSSGSGETIDVSDYGIFSDAVSVTTAYNSKLEDINTSIESGKTKISDDSVLMGPMKDNFMEVFSKIETANSGITTNFNAIAKYLTEAAAAYQAGDKEAKNVVLKIDGQDVVSSGTNGITADGNTKITIDQVQKCQSIEEYLNLVMPVYSYYAKKYGIKYPGVLALQPVHEHSAPTGIHAKSAVEDNNLGGLKYGSGIPNATPGSYPSDGTGGQYSHFNNVSEYIEAACWNIAKGSYYQDAMAKDNMDDFATTMINTWVGHSDNYGSNVVEEYKKYGLEKYEIQ